MNPLLRAISAADNGSSPQQQTQARRYSQRITGRAVSGAGDAVRLVLPDVLPDLHRGGGSLDRGAAIVGRIKGRRLGGTATRSIGAMIGLGLAWAIAVSPWLAPMVREARQFDFMIPDPTQSRTLSADLLAFVTPQAFHPLWGAWAQERSQVFTSTVSEYTVFAGFTALGLAGAGLWTTARRCRSARSAIERQTDWSRGLTGVFRLNPLSPLQPDARGSG